MHGSKEGCEKPMRPPEGKMPKKQAGMVVRDKTYTTPTSKMPKKMR